MEYGWRASNGESEYPYRVYELIWFVGTCVDFFFHKRHSAYSLTSWKVLSMVSVSICLRKAHRVWHALLICLLQESYLDRAIPTIHDAHIHSVMAKKYEAGYNDYNIQHDIKHNHACGSLSWLLFFHRILCHIPTESSYQQWRQTGFMKPISGLPSSIKLVCVHIDKFEYGKIMPGVEM